MHLTLLSERVIYIYVVALEFAYAFKWSFFYLIFFYLYPLDCARLSVATICSVI